MGLEAVELIMEVEDHFGIAIPINKVEHIHTVGDLIVLIHSRIEAAHLSSCPTLLSFLQLRTFVREIAKDDNLRIRTSTRVIDILGRAQRRQLWTKLDALLGSKHVRLQRTPALRVLLACVTFSAIGIAIATAAAVNLSTLPVTLTISAMVTLLLLFATEPFRTYPPEPLFTFGAITRRIATVNAATRQQHLRSVDSILEELRPLVVNTLGVAASKVVPHAKFVEDLGMG